MLEVDLFEDMQDSEVLSLLTCIGIKTKQYKKGSKILDIGQKSDCLIIILSGSANAQKPNILGEKEVIYELKVNDIFGQDYICLGKDKSPCELISTSNTEVLFLPYKKVITPCEKVCSYHLKLIKNLLKMIAKRNLTLNSQIDVVGQRNIREKVKTFLKRFSSEFQKDEFEIPYNREKMAEFLSTDRSALSRELCKMRSEGLLLFRKNHFKIFF